MIDVRLLPVPSEVSVFAQDVRQAVEDEANFYDGAAIIQAALDARVAEITARNAELEKALAAWKLFDGSKGVARRIYRRESQKITHKALPSQGGKGGE